MKISALSSVVNSLSNNYNKTRAKNNTNNHKTSFGSIYIEDTCNIGKASKSAKNPPLFNKSDALLLNEIAQDYPNQDCFIKRGYLGLPRLEYREKPPEVQIFTDSILGPYRIDIEPKDPDYPTVPLLIYDDSSSRNRMIGLPSFISLNPSLAFTVKAGYELHKKLMAKMYEIRDVLGRGDSINLGDESLIEKAHEAIEDTELAVTRYLLESAYVALTDRASAKQIYASNYPKVQSRLDAKRKLDLTVSAAKLAQINPKDFKDDKFDICEVAMRLYPNKGENKEAIEILEKYMYEHNIMI